MESAKRSVITIFPFLSAGLIILFICIIFLSEKYIELYKKLTGRTFIPYTGDVRERIIYNLKEKLILK